MDIHIKQNLEFMNIISEYFENLPESEKRDKLTLAKKINFFVYNFCSNTPPYTTDLEEIFKKPQTQCGGFVYVFRMIAEYFAIKTVSTFIFNIPNEGNHSLVQIEYEENKWALMDPTFGVFFSEDAEPENTPYGIEDIYFLFSEKDLKKIVVQAAKKNISDLRLPLTEIYNSGFFKADYMKLESYLKGEAYGCDSPNQYSVLKMTVDMASGVFKFGSQAEDIKSGEENFLKITNHTLNDELKENVSFNMSFLGSGGSNIFKNLYCFQNLEKNYFYQLTFYGFSQGKSAIKPYFIDNNAILEKISPYSLSGGQFEISMLFRAKNKNATLLLETCPKVFKDIPALSVASLPLLRIFGIQVESIGNLAIQRNLARGIDSSCFYSDAHNELKNFVNFPLLKAYIIQRLQCLIALHGMIALFPAGKHSKWLTGLIKESINPEKLIIFDDNLEDAMKMNGFKCEPSSKIGIYKFNKAVLSTDTQYKQLCGRAKELFGEDLLDLYEGLPSGAYCEK